MRGYFQNAPSRQGLLFIAAQSWIGTPFVPHASVRGAGVDCVNLAAQIYIECGFLREFTPPKYVMDGGKHNRDSQLLGWLDARPDFQKVNGEPMPGDLLCFKTGKSAHHVGLLIRGPHFINCLFAREVVQSTLTDRTFKRVHVATYRPIVP